MRLRVCVCVYLCARNKGRRKSKIIHHRRKSKIEMETCLYREGREGERAKEIAR